MADESSRAIETDTYGTLTNYWQPVSLMQDDEFEWDDEKAASNWLRHGIAFETAREAFKDAFAVDRVDNRHGDQEERFAMIAVVETQMLFVSYTMRGMRIRIISARKAEPYERRRYHNENQA